MLLYYVFWMFMGFIVHFYIIFWTNLLTQSQCQFLFLPCFRISQKRKTNGVQLTWNFTVLIFGSEEAQKTWSARQGIYEEATRQGARPRGAPPPSWPPLWSLPVGSKSLGSRSVRKSRSQRFHSVWTPFDILFLRYSKTREKQKLALGSRLIG